MDMLRQTWLRPVAESSMMAYGFFVDPGTNILALNNQVKSTNSLVSLYPARS